MFDSFDSRSDPVPSNHEVPPETSGVPRTTSVSAGANALDSWSLAELEPSGNPTTSEPQNSPQQPASKQAGPKDDSRPFLIDPPPFFSDRPQAKPRPYVEDYPFPSVRVPQPEERRRSWFLPIAIVVTALALTLVFGWSRIVINTRSATRALDSSLSRMIAGTKSSQDEAPAAGASNGSTRARGKPARADKAVASGSQTADSVITGLPGAQGSIGGVVRTTDGVLISMHALNASLPAANVLPPPPTQLLQDASPLIRHQVSPMYPESARVAGVQGDVALAVTIDASGNVVNARSIMGDYRLVDAAAAAVRQWRYRPLVWNGRPTPFETMVLMHFSLVSERP